MKLYVINLDRTPERLERLERIFGALHLELTRVCAIDAKTLCDDELKSIEEKNIWSEPLTKGEVACFLSHASALRLIAQGNDEYGAVFEDDVELSEAATQFLQSDQWIIDFFNDTNSSEAPCDMIKLETSGKKIWLGQAQKVNHINGQDFYLARLNSTHIMAAAYIISKKAAQKLLAEMECVSAPFDHLLFNFDYGIIGQLNAYQLDPAIAVQAKLPSTLQGERSQLTTAKKVKRTKAETIKREWLRLIKRTKIGIWGIFINLFTKTRWKRVPFADRKSD